MAIKIVVFFRLPKELALINLFVSLDLFPNSNVDTHESVVSVLDSSSVSIYTPRLRAEVPCPAPPSASFERGLLTRIFRLKSAVSSAVEHYTDTVGVGSSNLPSRTMRDRITISAHQAIVLFL